MFNVQATFKGNADNFFTCYIQQDCFIECEIVKGHMISYRFLRFTATAMNDQAILGLLGVNIIWFPYITFPLYKHRGN